MIAVALPMAWFVQENPGAKLKETKIDESRKMTYWKETIPLPTKVMVIGVAKFAVNIHLLLLID